MRKPVVFISSTSDLSQERQSLAAALRPLYEPYLYEEDRARRGSPQERCRQMIENSDVFVGVLGQSYGSLFPSAQGTKSIVEWEFDHARARRDLEIMAFIKHVPAGISIDPRQQQFLSRVQGFQQGVWCKFFNSTDDLVQSVRESLQKWLLDFWAEVQEASRRNVLGWLKPVLTLIAVVSVGLMLLLTATPLRERFSANSIIAMCIVCAALVLLGLVLLWREIGGPYVRYPSRT
jgi:hypothetical protein